MHPACPPAVSLRAAPPLARLTTGCPVLDGLLGGGLIPCGITEIVGGWFEGRQSGTAGPHGREMADAPPSPFSS